MSLLSLLMASHQTHAVTSPTHKKHIVKYLCYLWQCQMFDQNLEDLSVTKTIGGIDK